MNVKRLVNLLASLKALKRKGWTKHHIPYPESVAAHSWAVSLLALLFSDTAGISRQRALELALIHDLPEAIVGDLLPSEVSRKEKGKREHRAAHALARLSPVLYARWKEYALRKSPEARFVHELDKLDLYFQAVTYREAHGINVTSFLTSAKKEIKRPLLRSLIRVLHDRSQKKGKEKGKEKKKHTISR